MALKMEKVVSIPNGQHTGIIVRCHETTKVFDPRKGPEGVVEVIIQPAHKVEGHRTLPLSVVFSPSLNSLSAFGAFVGRMGISLADGQDFNPESMEGLEVAFESKSKEDGFVQVLKDSIRLNKKTAK